MTCLGLNLGTGLTKLARQRAGSGGAPAVTMVPAAMTYWGLTRELPAAPAHEPWPPIAVQCDRFPPMLDTALSADRITQWQSRTPGEGARGFLKCLLDLLEDEPESGTAPPRLVITVPPAAAAPRDPADDLLGAGSEPNDILTTLGREPWWPVPTPVAALFWLRHADPGLTTASRFMVVDTGAGSIEMSLYLVSRHWIRVTGSIGLIGRSAWGDYGIFGAGDRLPPLAECLVTAIAAAAAARVQLAASPASVSLWLAFEALADDDQRDPLDVVLAQVAAAGHGHDSTVAVRLPDRKVAASQLLDACAPIAQGAASPLGQYLVRQAGAARRAWRPSSGTRIVLIGGLSVLCPLRAPRCSPVWGLTQTGWSAPSSSPAATAGRPRPLAAGHADLGDRYPHAPRLEVSRVLRDRIVTEHLQLAAPGSIDLDTGGTVYLTHLNGTGEHNSVLVTVPHAVGTPLGAPIPVQLVLDGGEAVPATHRPTVPSSRVSTGSGSGAPPAALRSCCGRADGLPAGRARGPVSASPGEG